MIGAILAPLVWLAVLTRIRRWWWSRSVILGATTFALAVVAFQLTLNTPPVEWAVTQLAPTTNFSTAIRMVVFNFLAAAAGMLALAVAGRARHVGRLFALLLVAAALGSVIALALFLAAQPVPQAAGGFEFDQTYAHLPGFAEAGIAGGLFPAVLCPVLMATTARSADLHSLTGWSLTLISVGLLAGTGWAWIRLCYFVGVRFVGWQASPTPFEWTRVLAAAAALLVAVGVMIPAVGLWVRSRRLLREIEPLYAEMVARWPGVARESRRGSSADERAGDRVTELLDAVSMEFADMPGGIGGPPGEVAAAVAEWLEQGRRSPDFGRESIRVAAQQMDSDRAWALMLASAYRNQKVGQQA